LGYEKKTRIENIVAESGGDLSVLQKRQNDGGIGLGRMENPLFCFDEVG
jgi:hypothetical protein